MLSVDSTLPAECRSWVFTDAALVDQVKSLDWVARKARYKAKVWTAELREVRVDRRSGRIRQLTD